MIKFEKVKKIESNKIARGQCPVCKEKIGIFAAHILGLKQNFECRRCQSTIKKVRKYSMLPMVAFVSLFSTQRQYGYMSIEFLEASLLWLAFLSACEGYLSKYELVDECARDCADDRSLPRT